MRLTWLAAPMLLLLSGCTTPPPQPVSSTAPSSGTRTIGVSLMNRRQGFYKELETAMQAEADKEHVKLIITDANMASQKQLQDVEDLLVQRVDALIVAPVDSKSAIAPISKANADNVPVFTVDISSDGGKVVSHIASDNALGGQKAAQYMAAALHDKGKIGILDSPVVNSVIERVHGFEDEMKKHPGITIVEKIDGGAQRAPAMKAMENMLQAHGDLDGVFAINDETALGALSAIETAGRKNIIIVGYDATPDAQQAIRSGGPLKADVMQFPSRMGETAVKTATAYLAGQKVEDHIPVPVEVVDASSLASPSPSK